MAPPPVAPQIPCPAAPVAAPVAAPAAPPPVLAAQHLLDRLGEAFTALDRAAGDFAPREIHALPGNRGLVAVGDLPEPLADCNRGQPLVFVGRSRALVTWLTSGVSLVRQGGVAVFWDVRGDGSPPVVVVEERLCNFASSDHVYALDRDGEWFEAEGDARPSCPSCPRPEETVPDGRPLFSVHAASLTLASGGPYFPTAVDVRLFEAWDGSRFRSDLPAFAPLYQKRLDAARVAAKKARAKRGGCNTAAYQAAGEIYVLARVLGAPEAQALAEAERAVAGIDTAPCAALHADSMYGSTSYDWATIREELRAATEDLPVLAPPVGTAP